MKYMMLIYGNEAAMAASTVPPAESYAAAVFPSLDEQGAAKEAITKNWDSVVGANVQ